MKLILQIALGVFLGSLGSQLALEGWHARQERLAHAAQAQLRAANEAKVRALFQRGGTIAAPPPGFVPEDLREETARPPQ